MATKFPKDTLNPDNLSQAIDEYFRQHTSEEVVERAEKLTPRPTVSRRSEQSLSRIATEASWLLMVCHDQRSSVEAIICALRVCKQLTALSELIPDSMEQQDTPAIVRIQAKRMLVSQPGTMARTLACLVKSSKFREIEQNLSGWASSSQLPENKYLIEASEIFARIAPILEESSI